MPIGIAIETIGKYSNESDLGSARLFYQQLKERERQQMCRNIRIHREPVSFYSHFQKTKRSSMCDCRNIGNVHDPLNPLFLTLAPPKC